MNSKKSNSSKLDKEEIFNIDNLVIGENFYFIKKNSFSSEGQIVNKYDNCFAISIFCGQPKYTPLSINEKVQFIIANQNAAFNCSSTVLGCTLEDGFQLAVLTIPEITNKIERRTNPRITIQMPVDYLVFQKTIKYTSIKQVPSLYFDKMKKTISIDISNSGIKIVTDIDNAPSNNAIISLVLDQKIDILASVVRTDFDELNNKYKTAFEFKDIEKDKLEILNKFLDKKPKEIKSTK